MRDLEYTLSDCVFLPIFKGGGADDYRGVAFINVYSKIILIASSKRHNKIFDLQHGFQKNKSTIDCIFVLNSIIAKTLSQKKKLFCACIDFEKSSTQ